MSDLVFLIFADFEKDGTGLRALRRINMAQINLAKSGHLVDARTVGELKKLFNNRKGGVNQNG